MAHVKIKKDGKQEPRFAFADKQPKRSTKGEIVHMQDNEALVIRDGETLDEFMVRTGVYEKLLSQIENSTPSADWEAELDELRNRPA